ncbi:glycosyltransferase family 2 protein [Rhodococcus sp. SGAir0479]|uniref:glycosyltransferase family 2 protein n=1 Tax=Rhodococcus sp. SGAir0479 TaxID=2567884 RepID=UPI0010CD0CC4|nr:glycosyltransferase [Rhodococcus sp. SGAir0479]QCQ91351.1 glycosyltransferase [Rhodococcus sp. SGAir0479]
MARTTVVIATRDRPVELARTLCRLRTDLPGTPVVVVDNASADPLEPWIAGQYPDVEAIRLESNRGAAGRTVGVRRARTEFVAFCDDDSTWDPGAAAVAERTFDAYPTLGLLAARTLVGEDQRPDAITPALATSPLPSMRPLPGPRVLGFLACSAIVRRHAYLGAGGFDPLLHFAGEERLLALDLAARGWDLCYLPELIARHHPSDIRPPSAWRRRREMRNDALTEWMRRPVGVALGSTARLVGRGLTDASARGAASDVLRLLPSALSRRRPLPAPVERDVRLLEKHPPGTPAEVSP